MTLAFIGVLASLALVLALNWERFNTIGWGRVLKMLLIWLAIIIGLGILLRLLGQ